MDQKSVQNFFKQMTKDDIYDYTYELGKPTTSTIKKKMFLSQTLYTFAKINRTSIKSAIATYFLTDAIHQPHTIRIDYKNIKDVINSRDPEEDLNLVLFRYRVYLSPKGLTHFFYSNVPNMQSHHLAHHAIEYFTILEYVFVKVNLLAYISSPVAGLVFRSPHSYMIIESIRDIFERIGTLTKQTFKNRALEVCAPFKKLMKTKELEIKEPDTKPKDIFNIDIGEG